MFKPLELFIGLRYTRSKHKNHYISFISLASMLGITIGVIVLITVLSIMNGFEKELRMRILGMVAHVTVTGPDGQLPDWDLHQLALQTEDDVAGAAPYIEQQVMLSANGEVRGVQIQGILPEYQDNVSEVSHHVVDGGLDNLSSRGYGIAIGIELAGALGVFVGDKLTVITPQAKVTPAGVIPRMKRFTVVAVYKMNIRDYDSSTAFIHMDDAARLFKTRKNVTGIRLKLHNLFDAQGIAFHLQKSLGDSFQVTDWGRDNKTFFKAIKMEKIMMFFVLLLIVLVAIFNLVSSLVMVVNAKQADIAILRTLGMPAHQVKRIFMIQGSLVGLIGAATGAVLGVLLARNLDVLIPGLESLIGRKIFPEDVFYISTIPSDLQMNDVWLVTIATIVLAVVATLYPASRAASVQPADSLRYE
ncbi:MAG TPA: lipoprotein-releasing ABC transporter permease subunit [Leucothrix mucor]|nr:lipoprotein-releasing ABC transporter permease subunit [Leucothrix mucor]